MTKEIQTERRWLRSVIAASAEPLPNFPWMRGNRPQRAAAATAAQAPAPMPATKAPVLLFGRLTAIAAR